MLKDLLSIFCQWRANVAMRKAGHMLDRAQRWLSHARKHTHGDA